MNKERFNEVMEVYAFTLSWALGAEQGVCDEVCSVEFMRCLREYFIADCPDDVGAFIIKAANRPPRKPVKNP